MKALLCSAVLALSAVAIPASAAPKSQTGLPPGCTYVMGVLICVDMPLEGGG